MKTDNYPRNEVEYVVILLETALMTLAIRKKCNDKKRDRFEADNFKDERDVGREYYRHKMCCLTRMQRRRSQGIGNENQLQH